MKRSRKESDLQAEIEFHLSEEADERSAQGLPPNLARLAARKDFGSATLIREDARETWGWGFVERTIQDVRYALRTLRRHRGVSAVAALTLALGIGANTAIFSLVNGILLRPLPYPEAGRLVSITGTYPRGAFVEMRSSVRTMRVAAYAEGHAVNLTGLGEPIRLTATLISAELLSVLGAHPSLGGAFQPGEDVAGRDDDVILSHGVWEQQFARDAAMVGRSITLDGVSRRVVGVMPADFRFPSAKTQIWIPLHADPRIPATYWAGDFMPVVARLLPDATLEQARADVRRFQAHVPALFPWAMPANWNANVSVVPLRSDMVADVPSHLETTLRQTVGTLSREIPVSDVQTMHATVSDAVASPAAVMILFVAFASLALVLGSVGIYGVLSFLVSKRTPEIGIRVALGAQRRDVFRLIMKEGARLALAGIALGMAAAAAVTRVLSQELYGVDPADPLTYTAVAAVVMIVTMAACCVPTYRAMRVSPLIALRQA